MNVSCRHERSFKAEKVKKKKCAKESQIEFEALTFKEVKLEVMYLKKCILLLYLPLMFIFLLSTELISPQMHIKDPFPYCKHLEIHIPEPLQLVSSIYY